MFRTTALLILLIYAGAADAYGSLRCKGRLIDVGDSADEVVARCGEPAKRIITEVPLRLGTVFPSPTGTVRVFTRLAGCVTTEQWIYDRGWGKFPAVLHIDDGKIVRIDYLSKRKGDR